MNKAHKFSLLFIAAGLSACSTLKGPDIILDRNGPTKDPKVNQESFAAFKIFASDYDTSLNDIKTNPIYAGSKDGTPIDPATMQAQAYNAKKMAVSGFATISQNCDHFFNTAGREQPYIVFARDLTMNAGLLATGGLAALGVSAESIATVALATAGATTSLDLVRKNFLFGAENIEDVHVLTLKALKTHQDGVLAKELNDYDFFKATTDLLQNQSYCTPGGIMKLAQKAIKDKEFAAFDPKSGLTLIKKPEDEKAATKPASGSGAAADGGKDGAATDGNKENKGAKPKAGDQKKAETILKNLEDLADKKVIPYSTTMQGVFKSIEDIKEGKAVTPLPEPAAIEATRPTTTNASVPSDRRIELD